MLELYHRGDTICPMKVRIALAEKGLNWESHIVADLRSPEYLRLNRHGYLPTLVHDGRAFIESRIISEYLEDAFPEPPLMPKDALGRYRARLWSKQIDDSLHFNIFILTFLARGAWGLGSASEEERRQRLPKDPVKRDLALELLRDGAASRWLAGALERFILLLDDMDKALDEAPWLAGDAYSLADIDLTAYVFRLEQMHLDLLWQNRPRLRDWYDRVRSRPSFEKGVLAWLTVDDRKPYEQHAHVVVDAARKRLVA